MGVKRHKWLAPALLRVHSWLFVQCSLLALCSEHAPASAQDTLLVLSRLGLGGLKATRKQVFSLMTCLSSLGKDGMSPSEVTVLPHRKGLWCQVSL